MLASAHRLHTPRLAVQLVLLLLVSLAPRSLGVTRRAHAQGYVSEMLVLIVLSSTLAHRQLQTD